MFQWIRRFSLKQIVLFCLLLIFAPPLIASSILVLVDILRKKNRLQGHFLSLRDEPVVDVGGTEVKIYTYGNDLFDAMLDAIQHAEKRIELESFIWKADIIGTKFKQAITDAARRGVEVYVIYDQFANLVVPSAFKCFDPAIHVLVYPLFSFPFLPLSIKSYARDHRKVLVVDSHIGFVGGYNIGDTYATQWRDTHARMVGSGVLELENTFIDFWNEHKNKNLPEIPDLKHRSWLTMLMAQRNDPVMLTFPIRSSYLEAIDRAGKSFYLTNAYFIPDRKFLLYLIDAVKRGVDVRVLIPAVSNHVVADWLSRGFYTDCLKGGVRLFLYEGAMVHAKTATADGQWSTIGTANLDRLSMLGNFEVNIDITDAGVAREMEKIFEYDTLHTHELTLEEWEQRPFIWRVGERMLYRFRPFF